MIFPRGGGGSSTESLGPASINVAYFFLGCGIRYLWELLNIHKSDTAFLSQNINPKATLHFTVTGPAYFLYAVEYGYSAGPLLFMLWNTVTSINSLIN